MGRLPLSKLANKYYRGVKVVMEICAGALNVDPETTRVSFGGGSDPDASSHEPNYEVSCAGRHLVFEGSPGIHNHLHTLAQEEILLSGYRDSFGKAGLIPAIFTAIPAKQHPRNGRMPKSAAMRTKTRPRTTTASSKDP